MAGHLAPAGVRIVLGSHRLEKHVERRDAQHETKRAIPIIRIHEVMARPEDKPCRGLHALLPRPADLKKCLVLALELDFAVIDSPRKIHRAVDSEKILPAQALVLGGLEFRRIGACLNRHAVSPRDAP